MLPPSIDRSDFGAQRLRELEEQQINLHHLCSAVLDDGDVDIPPPPPPGSHRGHGPRRFSPSSPVDVDHCDLMTGEVHSFSSSFSDEHFRKREWTPSPCNEHGIYNDGTVATPHSRQGSLQNPCSPAALGGGGVSGLGSTVNYVPATATGDLRSRTSPPAVRSTHTRGRAAVRPPPPPPTVEDDDDDDDRHERHRSDHQNRRVESTHTTTRADMSFQEAYRKYVLAADANPRGRASDGGKPSPVTFSPPSTTNTITGERTSAGVGADSRSTSVVSTIRSTGKYVTGTAYKKYLTSSSQAPSSVVGTETKVRAATPLTLLPPPPSSPPTTPTTTTTTRRNAAGAAAAAPSATNTYQPSSRSVSEQSDYSNYSKTAATISKWRKVLYAGSSVHNNSHSQPAQDVSSEWHLHGPEDGHDRQQSQRMPPPPPPSHDYLVISQDQSRSVSCVSGEVSGYGSYSASARGVPDARELVEREERKIKRYFQDGDRHRGGYGGSIRKEEEEWNVTTALNFVERRRRDGTLQAPAAVSSAASSQYGGAGGGYFESPTSRSMSLEHPYNDASPDGLVPDMDERSNRRRQQQLVVMPPPPGRSSLDDLSNGSQEFFDEDPVRSFLQQRLSTNIQEEDGATSQKHKHKQRHQMVPPSPSPPESVRAGKCRPPPSAATSEDLTAAEVHPPSSAALVPQAEALPSEALQLEVQKTRDKAEALARHLVRALEEKRQLQEHLAQMEHERSTSRTGQLVETQEQGKDGGGVGGVVVATPSAAEKATAGVQAALRTKERELAIYEEEIQRLNGLLLQQQEMHATTPHVVLAAQAAAAAEVDAAINEVGLAHLSQRKAEERADKLASELESAVNVIYTLDGRVAELQKAAMEQKMEEIRSTALGSGGGCSPDRLGSSAPEAQQALVELIRRAEGLLHQSDATSSHTAAYLQSLQHTCRELRRQLYEKGGEVEELQDQCNALRRDKNVLRLYGAQWLQQLVDVQADAEVIADIVHTSREDAERVVTGSIQADSLLNTSISTLDGDVSQPIREYNSTSRQFAELVIHDMHAVARYLAALRRMNIGEKEGYTLLERLANGKPLLLLEEDGDGDDDEPSLGLPEPARQLVQQKKQFVLDAVEEALRMRRQSEPATGTPTSGRMVSSSRARRGNGPWGDSTEEEEADELVLPYPPVVKVGVEMGDNDNDNDDRVGESAMGARREASPPPLPQPRQGSEEATPTSHTRSRERSTTLKPADVCLDSGSRSSRPRHTEEETAAESHKTSESRKKHHQSSSSRRTRDEEYDEPSLPFFGGSAVAIVSHPLNHPSEGHNAKPHHTAPSGSETTSTTAAAAAPATLNVTLPPRSASTTTVPEVPPMTTAAPNTNNSDHNSPSIPSCRQAVTPAETEAEAEPSRLSGSVTAAVVAATSSPTSTSRRGFSPESSFGVIGSASLPQLQRSTTPSRQEGSGHNTLSTATTSAAATSAAARRPAPRHANAGMMETSQPLEPQRADTPPVTLPTTPRTSQNLSPASVSPPTVRHTASPPQMDAQLPHRVTAAANESEDAHDAFTNDDDAAAGAGARRGTSPSAAPAAATTVSGLPIRISMTPSPNRASVDPVSITVSTPTHMFDTPAGTTQRPTASPPPLPSSPSSTSPTLGDRLPIPTTVTATTTTTTSVRRHQLDDPARPAVTDLPAPATGNPFGEMSQPAAPPGAPGGSPQPADPVRERRLAAALSSPRSAVLTPIGSSTSGSVPASVENGPAMDSGRKPVSPLFSGRSEAESAEEASSSLKLPPRPYTKTILTAQQRAALRPRVVPASSSVSSAEGQAEQQTPSANVSSTDSVVAEAMNLSPIVAQPDFRSTSLNSMPNGSSLESSTMMTMGVTATVGGQNTNTTASASMSIGSANQNHNGANRDEEAKRKENVAKILERLRAAKK